LFLVAEKAVKFAPYLVAKYPHRDGNAIEVRIHAPLGKIVKQQHSIEQQNLKASGRKFENMR